MATPFFAQNSAHYRTQSSPPPESPCPPSLLAPLRNRPTAILPANRLRPGPGSAATWSTATTETDPINPETGDCPPNNRPMYARPRASASRIPNGKRSRPLPNATRFQSPSSCARVSWRSPAAVIPSDLAPLIERTFRYTYMLTTLRRYELVRDGRGDELEELVEPAWQLRGLLQTADSPQCMSSARNLKSLAEE